jgi:hypothetical protein
MTYRRRRPLHQEAESGKVSHHNSFRKRETGYDTVETREGFQLLSEKARSITALKS